MSSSTPITQRSHQMSSALRSTTHRLISLPIILVMLAVSACQPPKENRSGASLAEPSSDAKLAAIQIKDDTIILSPHHILTVKTKRYQPSLGLRGITFPLQMTTLTSPVTAIVHDLQVTEDEQVKKAQPLLTLRPLATPAKVSKRPPSASDYIESDTHERTGTSAPSPKRPEPAPSPQTEAIATFDDATSTAAQSAPAIESTTTAALPPDDAESLSSHQPQTKAPHANKPQNPDNMTSADAPDTTPLSSAIDSVANTAAQIVKDTEAAGRALTSTDDKSDRPSPDQVSGLNRPKVHERIEQPPTQTPRLKAPFSGHIDQLYIKPGQRVSAQQPLLKLSTPHDLQFIGTLPLKVAPQLSVGQHVNFTVAHSIASFSGQVSRLVPAQHDNKLRVYVHVDTEPTDHHILKSGMTVVGRIDFGQIQVGTIVPKAGIQDADLTSLTAPPYRPEVPIKAYVWIIKQNERLTRQPVEVIEYDPDTEQYLVTGISNDSLICLAPLPLRAEGKKVIVS